MKTHLEAKDTNVRGWTVVGATFVTLGLVYGIWYSYAVFLVAFLHEFGWSRSLVAGAFSVLVLVHGSFSPIVGWSAGRVGPRRLIRAGGCILGLGLLLTAETATWWHLYVAFGGVVAVGVGTSGWVSSVVLVQRWFPDRIGTALGVASSGIGMGMSVLVPFAQFLVERVGWRWGFRILAAMIVGWVVPATVWLVRDEPSSEVPKSLSGSRDARPFLGDGAYWTLATAVRDWHFWGLAAVFCTGNVATQMLLVHQIAYLVDHGVPAMAAAAVGGVAGLASIVGKLGWGTLSDRTNRELAYSLAFGCVAASVGLLTLAGAYPSSWLPYVYGVFIGLGYAATAPLTPAAASDLFSGPGFSTIFGTLHMGNALGAATGPWVAGQIFDRTGSYALALWVALGVAVLSPVFLWVVAPRHPHPPPSRR